MSAFYKTYHLPSITPEPEQSKPANFKKKYTEDEIKTIIKMRNSGASWDDCGAALNRTGESCYKAMKNRTYRANKALNQSKQKPAAPVKSPVKSPDSDRLHRAEIQIRALTATLSLMAVLVLLMVVDVI